ncbi:MAG: hypothetical protein U0W24_25365 [Bacteroidales bacterium]
MEKTNNELDLIEFLKNLFNSIPEYFKKQLKLMVFLGVIGIIAGFFNYLLKKDVCQTEILKLMFLFIVVGLILWPLLKIAIKNTTQNTSNQVN